MFELAAVCFYVFYASMLYVLELASFMYYVYRQLENLRPQCCVNAKINGHN